jgi:hypothetical protein
MQTRCRMGARGDRVYMKQHVGRSRTAHDAFLPSSAARYIQSGLSNLHLSIRSIDVQDDYSLWCGRTRSALHVIVKLSASKN